MRVLVVSDLHYRLRHFDWLVDAADRVDVVAIVGDLADVVSPVPLDVQIVVLRKYLNLLSDKAIVLVSSGNHDLDGPAGHGEQVAGWLQGAAGDKVHVDGRSVDLEGTRFTICPWWDGPKTRDAVGEQLAAAGRHRADRWIWLYHSPPAGTVLCRDGRREFPDPDLAAWIGQHQPDLVLCGHIHQAPWVDGGSWNDRLGSSWVFNAGKQRGPVPAHITLDTDAMTAEWFGVFSVETVTLAD